jgi:hypothetical protein
MPQCNGENCEVTVKGRAKLCPVCKDKKKKAEEKPLYSHESNKRCTALKKSHPSFLGIRCDKPMRAVGTIKGGQFKNWKCECGWRTRTEGKRI